MCSQSFTSNIVSRDLTCLTFSSLILINVLELYLSAEDGTGDVLPLGEVGSFSLSFILP